MPHPSRRRHQELGLRRHLWIQYVPTMAETRSGAMCGRADCLISASLPLSLPPPACNSPLVKNAAGDACVAAVSQRRKRDQLALEKPGACAWGMQACSVIGISGRRTSKFECLDTKTSIESCGGCMFPLRNQPAGEDCTLIPMVESVSCTRGRCAVSSCVRGFEVSESGDSCVKVAKK